jgi:hypothetical protein
VRYVSRLGSFLLGLTFLAMTNVGAQNVSPRCPGHDGIGPFSALSYDGTVSWPKMDLDTIVVINPSLSIVTENKQKYFLLSVTQIRPRCYASGTIFAELHRNGGKIKEVNLVHVEGKGWRPNPPKLMQWRSNEPIGLPDDQLRRGPRAKDGVYPSDDITYVNLSFDCNCLHD